MTLVDIRFDNLGRPQCHINWDEVKGLDKHGRFLIVSQMRLSANEIAKATWPIVGPYHLKKEKAE